MSGNGTLAHSMHEIVAMKMALYLGTALLVVALLLPGPAQAAVSGDASARGLEIARAADQANQGFRSERATMRMELINAHGDVTRRKLTVETLEVKGDGDRSRAELEWPADIKGTKLLTWAHGDRNDDQWLYLPAIKRIRRISGSSKRGSFVGSEFSYEDLASNEFARFTYRYLDEPKLRGRDTYRIERTPVDRDSGYARQVVWLDKEYQSPLLVQYHGRDSALLKVATFEGYMRYGKYWRATTVTMENLQTKKKTVITWDGRDLGLQLRAESFDSARLED